MTGSQGSQAILSNRSCEGSDCKRPNPLKLSWLWSAQVNHNCQCGDGSMCRKSRLTPSHKQKANCKIQVVFSGYFLASWRVVSLSSGTRNRVFRAAKYKRVMTSTRRVTAKSHIITQTREGNTLILMTFVSGTHTDRFAGKNGPLRALDGSRKSDEVASGG